MARLLIGLCLLLAPLSAALSACATGQDKLEPHTPGDPCIDTCPEGMACTGTVITRSGRTYPGRCELAPGRCATDGDCARSARCVRSSDRIGLCAEAPQL